MTLDRPTLLAAVWTLVAALPVHLVMSKLPFPDPYGAAGVEAVGEAAPAAPEADPVAPESAPAPVAAPPPAPVLPAARVTGKLRTPDGTPIPDEAIELESGTRDARYLATSDPRGRFSIPHVALAPDYEVRVSSGGRYTEFVRSGVSVGADGLELDLVLEPLSGARLSGRMVDADGVPVPLRTLLLEGSHQPGQALLITGDERGRFRVDAAPTGQLSFSTRRVPLLRVRGPLLAPGTEADVVLVLDEGSHELAGRVVGDRGIPVAGVQLKLSWLHKHGEAIASSARSAVTDASGGFRFTGLGPGPHQLDVRAEGYEDARETYGVYWNSPDVELRLRPTWAR